MKLKLLVLSQIIHQLITSSSYLCLQQPPKQIWIQTRSMNQRIRCLTMQVGINLNIEKRLSGYIINIFAVDVLDFVVQL